MSPRPPCARLPKRVNLIAFTFSPRTASASASLFPSDDRDLIPSQRLRASCCSQLDNKSAPHLTATANTKWIGTGHCFFSGSFCSELQKKSLLTPFFFLFFNERGYRREMFIGAPRAKSARIERFDVAISFAPEKSPACLVAPSPASLPPHN